MPIRTRRLLALLLAASPGCGDDSISNAVDRGSGGGTATTSSTETSTGGGGDGSGGILADAGSDAPVAPPPGIAFLDLAMPVDLTPDGSIALLQDAASPNVDVYFYDTVSGQLDLKTQVGDPLKDMATAISGNRRITALHDVPVQAGVWSEADGWMDLASVYPNGCDPDIAGAWDLSADGTVVVGIVWKGCGAEAFRWSEGADEVTPLELLGSSAPGSTAAPSNRATALSDDGLVAVGFAQHGPIDRTPALWRADGSGVLLDPTEQEWPGECLSISADGQVVAGTRGYDGFIWTEADGMQSLGKLPAAEVPEITYPNAVSAGGQLVFGAVGDAWMTIPVAFVWTPAAGLRPLADIVAASGIVVPEGYLLTNVLAASADGSVVLGTAFDADANTKSFVLRLPISAYGS